MEETLGVQEDMMTGGGRSAMDGCATFYRRERFTLVKKYEVEFNKAAQSYMDGSNHSGDKRRNVNRLMKPNVALILVLEGVENSAMMRRSEGGTRALVCVANTHIHANHELADVKLWQVSFSRSRLSSFIIGSNHDRSVCHA
jgi:CCR4-NOT transcription complex subunit 6